MKEVNVNNQTLWSLPGVDARAQMQIYLRMHHWVRFYIIFRYISHWSKVLSHRYTLSKSLREISCCYWCTNAITIVVVYSIILSNFTFLVAIETLQVTCQFITVFCKLYVFMYVIITNVTDDVNVASKHAIVLNYNNQCKNCLF